MDGITFRRATTKDVPFLVDVIVEAEKSGTETLSYVAVFGLTENEVRKYIRDMLLEEIEGCGELSISSYFLAEKNNDVIAAACAWVEGNEGMPTSVLKGNLLNFIIPKEAILKASKLHSLLHVLHFDYKPNAIHVGAAYVTKENRGFNLGGVLKKKIIEILVKNHPKVTEMYVDTFSNVKASIRTNEKLGFELVEIKESKNPNILKYLPSNKKILMKKTVK